MKYLLLLPAFLFLVSCDREKHNTVKPQPQVLEKNCGFDLELINFNENVPRLYSKHVLNETGVEYEESRDGKITDSTFKYTISNTITDVMHFKIPQEDFGYRYKTPETDSLAKFRNSYFNTLAILTNKLKKPVAWYTEARFDSIGLRNQFLASFIRKYGKPRYSFYISHEFNHCAYEWDLNDRTIQIETSHGFEMTMSTDGNNKNGKYYRLDMLILDNKEKDGIYKAHVFEVPDKIMYDGKLHSYRDFQFEKSMPVRDEFLLFSTNEAYIKNEYGEYTIDSTAVDE